MSYPSVDQLQKHLEKEVFHYAKDGKKAAGRALGTLVEIITFYVLKHWGLEKFIAIERRLPEYANPEITHNVEFSLHPSIHVQKHLYMDTSTLPLTSSKILKRLSTEKITPQVVSKNGVLLTKDFILRNACVLAEDKDVLYIAYLTSWTNTKILLDVYRLRQHPFAVVECKRVGVEDGMKKGPQTIEKAKQGAYVARMVSSLQKIRTPQGATFGVMYLPSGDIVHKPFLPFLDEVIASEKPDLLKDFTLTVGVVSNHGNWFTSDDHNKELKVLAQSYDWLLFLSDKGLVQFISDLLLENNYPAVKASFIASYSTGKNKNRFTKVQMDMDADREIRGYISRQSQTVEGWFNIISPREKKLPELKRELTQLAGKNWEEILQ
ncbi:MAG: hypothetical protein ACRC10_12205 [Thermoguttaceae bacterium]